MVQPDVQFVRAGPGVCVQYRPSAHHLISCLDKSGARSASISRLKFRISMHVAKQAEPTKVIIWGLY